MLSPPPHRRSPCLCAQARNTDGMICPSMDIRLKSPQTDMLHAPTKSARLRDVNAHHMTLHLTDCIFITAPRLAPSTPPLALKPSTARPHHTPPQPPATTPSQSAKRSPAARRSIAPSPKYLLRDTTQIRGKFISY